MPKQILEEILKRYPEKDRKIILESFEFAKAAHAGQKRFSGEDYIVHPLRAAFIVSQLKLDSQAVAATFLHDVLDDTKVSPEELEKKFGKEISFLVKGVSALGRLRLPKQNLDIGPIDNRKGRPINLEIENLRRMFFAMAEDVRVILIKLADRVHNMETLEFIPKEKQQRFALETMEVFAPLAGRLSINRIKTKLENLAFPYLYPKEYHWLLENVKEKHDEARKYLDRAKSVMEKHLGKEKIDFLEIQTRLKSYFSLYQKLLKYEMNFDRIYDLAAVRIIVKDVKTCYEALGIVHKYWRPLPGRIKDYIAFPKPNGYQSLHTTVFCGEKNIIEVQIRTKEMHENANYGICAHWARKQGINLKKYNYQFAWVQQLANWQKENQNIKDFIENLKIDFFKNRIFILTPKGDVIDLPDSACPIDFAYAVHSDLGDHCVGAKINGKFSSLSTVLKNGDVVEIMIDKNRWPSRDWMRLVKTGLAKSHIRKRTAISIFSGFQALKEKFFPEKKKQPLITQETSAAAKALSRPVKSNIIIGGKTGVSYILAKCCQPKTGEEVIAYLTKNRSASIHRSNCQNFKKLKSRWPEKIIEAKWQ
ncbi:MAG: RelA/SpoT family protein [bacterium]|nr:RelA/SpoT family protein [bacterium]